MADELHQLLAAAAVSAPYVLAGHSFGGIIARRFAARYPSAVAGMVLIDSSHEDQARRLKDGSCRRGVLLRALRRQVRILGLRRLAAAAGLVRGLDDTTLAREVLPEFTGAARAVSLSTQHRRACVQEMCIIAQPSGPPPSLGSLPLTVLTAAGRDRAWMWLQDELASLSPDSEHIIAREAGHCLHLDEPQLVIETLLDLLTRIS